MRNIVYALGLVGLFLTVLTLFVGAVVIPLPLPVQIITGVATVLLFSYGGIVWDLWEDF